MIGNVSGNYSNNTLARSPGGGVSRSGARLLLQTATALSMASPRRAAPGRRSKQRTAVQTSGAGPLPVPGLRRQGHEGRASGVRVRESGRSAERVLNKSHGHPHGQESDTVGLSAPRKAKGRKGNKGRAGQEPRPAGGRTGSTPSAASLRQRRQAEALEDQALAHSRQRRSHSSVWDTYVPRCQKQQAVPVYQHNFTAIADNLAGCYRQAENIRLQGHQTQALPIGNRTHPFRGSLDGDSCTLSVDLTRTQGDAVLFGRIEHSELRLSVVDSHLETGNGSRAALIGTLGGHNRIILSGLDNNLFRATGEGIVEAGLVAHTRRGDNWLELNGARGNRVEAHALPPSDHCADACLHRASVSLGLGTLVAVDGWADSLYAWQRVWQRGLSGNQLHARAGGAAQPGGADVPAQAAAGVLGILGDRSGNNEILWSWQEEFADNRIEAHALPGAGIRAAWSHASPGYACMGCDLQPPAAHTRDERLEALQAGFRNNSVQALADRPAGMAGVQDEAFEAVARTNLLSTAFVDSLRLHQRGLEAGQLQAEAGTRTDNSTALVEQALLPGIRDGRLYLFSDGDAALPFFVGNDTQLQVFANSTSLYRSLFVPGCIDGAGYLHRPFDASQRQLEALLNSVTVSSLDPGGWRFAHDRLRSSLGEFLLGPTCGGHNSRLHYPNEDLQLLLNARSEWQLLSRQRYPDHPEHDRQGLLRLTRYRVPDGGGRWPQNIADAQDRGVVLYQPRAQDAALQQGEPVASLVQNRYLFHWYQSEGQPAQLVVLPRRVSNGHYELAQYDDLAGQPRLLSNERGGLELWSQGDNDTLLVYALGSNPTSNISRLRWGFDLAEQPGGPLLLARSRQWLYSLRQEEGQPASLRRWQLDWDDLRLDRDWQPVWPGNVSESQRLVAANGYLSAVPTGVLPDPHRPGIGWQARVPTAGGCLQWTRLALAHYPLPAEPPARTPGTAASPAFSSASPTTAATLSTFSPASPAAGEQATQASSGEQEPAPTEKLWGSGFALGWGTGLVAGSIVIGTACAIGWTCPFSKCRRGRRPLPDQDSSRPTAEELPRPATEVVRQEPFLETAI